MYRWGFYAAKEDHTSMTNIVTYVVHLRSHASITTLDTIGGVARSSETKVAANARYAIYNDWPCSSCGN